MMDVSGSRDVRKPAQEGRQCQQSAQETEEKETQECPQEEKPREDFSGYH